MNINNVIQKDFYNRKTSIVAKELLGKLLVRNLNGNYLGGRIIETEAYLPVDDEASHQSKGKTKRNEILFGEPGFTYVYSIHRYHCLNISTEPFPIAGCVLIRAIEPLEGIEVMKQNREVEDIENLVNGPGKLCKALNITRELNGVDVTSKDSKIFILGRTPLNPSQIQTTPRIGISKSTQLPLRFIIY